MARWSIRQLMLAIAIVAVSLTVMPLISPVYHTNCTWTPQQQCTNNIHNVALAVLGFQLANGSFPCGTVPKGDLRPDQRLSLYAPLTPYMESPELFDRIDQTLPWHGCVNQAIAGERIGILRCPCAARVLPPSLPPTTTIGVAGLGVDAPLLAKAEPRAGIFGYDRVTTPADIKDGASATMMFAESGIEIGSWLQGGTATVRGLDPAKKPCIGPGRQFGGLHDGVAIIAMADGSVRVVKESIAPAIFEAMSTMAGGECTGSE
jgi:prepilin-type processing-associated H-X9-DG protein